MKRNLATALSIFFLSLIFALLCFAVWITCGDPRLIKAKLKIGALLLLLQGSTSGCFPVVSCYAPPFRPSHVLIQDVSCDPTNGCVVTFDPAVSDTIHGVMEFCTTSTASFAITDTSGSDRIIQTGPVIAKSGNFSGTEDHQEFYFLPDRTLPPGRFRLEITAIAYDSITVPADITTSMWNGWIDIIAASGN